MKRVGNDSRLPVCTQQSALHALGDQCARALVERYADAIERGDPETLISMLTQDATWSMPVPTWYRGHRAIRQFLVRYPLTGCWQHRPAQANGQLAVAGCLVDPVKAATFPPSSTCSPSTAPRSPPSPPS